MSKDFFAFDEDDEEFDELDGEIEDDNLEETNEQID